MAVPSAPAVTEGGRTKVRDDDDGKVSKLVSRVPDTNFLDTRQPVFRLLLGLWAIP